MSTNEDAMDLAFALGAARRIGEKEGAEECAKLCDALASSAATKEFAALARRIAATIREQYR